MSNSGLKVVENLFFSISCVSVFTCIIRSDYNFALGLLGYYMIKNARKNHQKVINTVSNSTGKHVHTTNKNYRTSTQREPKVDSYLFHHYFSFDDFLHMTMIMIACGAEHRFDHYGHPVVPDYA